MSLANKTVLIVEDSPTQAMHLEHLLSLHGFSVTWAHNGAEGLRSAQLHQFDIILLDIELPYMNGIQMCEELKKNAYTRAIPVILLTHLNNIEAAKLGLQTDLIECIPKGEHADDKLLEALKTKRLINKIILT